MTQRFALTFSCYRTPALTCVRLSLAVAQRTIPTLCGGPNGAKVKKRCEQSFACRPFRDKRFFSAAGRCAFQEVPWTCPHDAVCGHGHAETPLRLSAKERLILSSQQYPPLNKVKEEYANLQRWSVCPHFLVINAGFTTPIVKHPPQCKLIRLVLRYYANNFNHPGTLNSILFDNTEIKERFEVNHVITLLIERAASSYSTTPEIIP
uniref:DDE-1 domain-containing protein n=1 Tax=Steinernema glaseri TaxID=37863 RepID=A0A1I8AK36_9BILA